MVDSTRTPPAGRRLAALGHDTGAQARLDASASPCVVKRTALGKALERLPQSRKRPGYARRRIRTREIVGSTIYAIGVGLRIGLISMFVTSAVLGSDSAATTVAATSLG